MMIPKDIKAELFALDGTLISINHGMSILLDELA
jgi:hypothetical protein